MVAVGRRIGPVVNGCHPNGKNMEGLKGGVLDGFNVLRKVREAAKQAETNGDGGCRWARHAHEYHA